MPSLSMKRADLDQATPDQQGRGSLPDGIPPRCAARAEGAELRPLRGLASHLGSRWASALFALLVLALAPACDGGDVVGFVDRDGDGASLLGGDCDDTVSGEGADGYKIIFYPDGDGDGYPGNAEKYPDTAQATVEACAPPEGYLFVSDPSTARFDCDDRADNVYPDAREDGKVGATGPNQRGDGFDNDCDGKTDEYTTTRDDDGDKFCEVGYDINGNSNCTDPNEEDEANSDCDDGVNCSEGDLACLEQARLINPQASEFTIIGTQKVGTGVDNDCDDRVDEGSVNRDDDEDGYCEAGYPVRFVPLDEENLPETPPDGYSSWSAYPWPYYCGPAADKGKRLTNEGGGVYPGNCLCYSRFASDGSPNPDLVDCADDPKTTVGANTIYPGAPEIPYDDIDQDCNGIDLIDVDQDGIEGDDDCGDGGYCITNQSTCDAACQTLVPTEENPDPIPACLATCRSAYNACILQAKTIYPGATEVAYDNIDQDCDGADLGDVDLDGYCSQYKLDKDGDRVVDEDGNYVIYDFDPDFDDPRNPLLSGATCRFPQADCDDAEVFTFPGAEEDGADGQNETEDGLPGDGEDNDCDGEIDEATLNRDDDRDGFCEAGYPVEFRLKDGEPPPNAPPADMLKACNDDLSDDPSYPVVIEGETIQRKYNGDCVCYSDQNGDGIPDISPQDAIKDCNDRVSSTYPGATEVPYDKVDQDCNGFDVADFDQDGYCLGGLVGYNYENAECDFNQRDCNDGITCNAANGNCTNIPRYASGAYTDEVRLEIEEGKAINPGKNEIPYDGIDQNCDQYQVDLLDVDADGFCPALSTIKASCGGSCDGVFEACLDSCAGSENEGLCEQACSSRLDDCEEVCNEMEDQIVFETCPRADDGDDCNDVNNKVYPGAPEDGLSGSTPNGDGFDNNCNGRVDENTIHRDDDADGFCEDGFVVKFIPSTYETLPTATPEGYDSWAAYDWPGYCAPTAEKGLRLRKLDGSLYSGDCLCDSEFGVSLADCDDTNAGRFPGNLEIPYDRIDQDCDENNLDVADVDGDGYCKKGLTAQGYSYGLADCPEGINDCDDGDGDTCLSTYSTCVGACADGNTTCLAACQTAKTTCLEPYANIYPLADEIYYDGVDQDCNGKDLADVDADGYCADTTTIAAARTALGLDPAYNYALASCPAGTADCNDSDAVIYPEAEEEGVLSAGRGDRKDNDCDLHIDEGTNNHDDDDDGFCEAGFKVKFVLLTTEEAPSGLPASYAWPGYCGPEEDQYLRTTKAGGGQYQGDCLCYTENGSDSIDCNDTVISTYPGAPEVPYDSVDQNCDTLDLADYDGDGFCRGGIPGYYYPGASCPGGINDCEDGKDCYTDYAACLETCEAGDLTCRADCEATNDTCVAASALVSAGDSEIPYDGVDQDCDGTDLADVDGDGHCLDPEGIAAARIALGLDPAYNYALASCRLGKADCDDGYAFTYPGAVENGTLATDTGDTRDNDCDGSVDEDTRNNDDDDDGFCEDGYIVKFIPEAGTELPPDLESDYAWPGYCGAEADRDQRLTDGDGALYPGDCLCYASHGSVADRDAIRDCDDEEGTTYPNAPEEPYDKIDQDCDGFDLADVDGDGYCKAGLPQYQYATLAICPLGVTDCNDGASCDASDTACLTNAAGINPSIIEGESLAYNGIDEDCSGYDLLDVDGDRFCPPASELIPTAAAQINNITCPKRAVGTDCDDLDETVYPLAPEDGAAGLTFVGDGKDNDCDIAVDEDTNNRDDDEDGYCEAGFNVIFVPAVEVPVDFVATGYCAPIDPDDACTGADPRSCNPDTGAPYVGDCLCFEANGVGLGDCNDRENTTTSAPSVYPGAREVPYDGIDQDCNGKDVADVDGDGYCKADLPTTYDYGLAVCQKGRTDCDDGDACASGDAACVALSKAINPGVVEGASLAYNEIDEDCSGFDLADVDKDGHCLDEDGIGDARAAAGLPREYDYSTASCPTSQNDCNDTLTTVSPEASEVCDGSGVDENCNGQVNEDNAVGAVTFYTDLDCDGYGVNPSDTSQTRATRRACSVTYDYASGACSLEGLSVPADKASEYDHLCAAVRPDVEDYPSSCAAPQRTQVVGGIEEVAWDCNDNLNDTDQFGAEVLSATVFPGAAEVPNNGVDENCNGIPDDDGDQDGYTTDEGDCDDTLADVHPCFKDENDCVADLPELTGDVLDNDCDGCIDEGSPGDGYSGIVAGSVIVSEVMFNPYDRDQLNEWIELYNPGSEAVYLNGYSISNETTFLFKISKPSATSFISSGEPLRLEPGEHILLAKSQNPSVNGGIVIGNAENYYVTTSTDWFLSNDFDNLYLDARCDDNFVDRTGEESIRFIDDYSYDPPALTFQSNFTIQTDPLHLTAAENHLPAYTCNPPLRDFDEDGDVDSAYSANNYGTPGYANLLCGNVDHDGDGLVDDVEFSKGTLIQNPDTDGDGFCDGPKAVSGYALPDGSGTVTCALFGGKADNCPLDANPGQEDLDGNGVGDECDTDQDGDGYTVGDGDCNDSNALVNPGASEACNGTDDDCDTRVDEGVQTVFYPDDDEDTYGDSAGASLYCNGSEPSGFVTNGADCNDDPLYEHPDGGGKTGADVNPLSPETCNGIDDDCDGLSDALDTELAVDDVQLCEEQAGVCSGSKKPVSLCQSGIWRACNDAVYTSHATNTFGASYEPDEVSCDSVDNDCDTSVDEDVTTPYYPDADEDSYGSLNGGQQRCTPRAGYVTTTGDCDDTDPDINPDGVEVCDGEDNDCNGLIDAAEPTVLLANDLQQCEKQLGVCEGSTKPASLCTGGGWAACNDTTYGAYSVNYSTSDAFDEYDNDCDGCFNEEGLDDALVVISEIQFNPTGFDGSAEYLELYNGTESALAINGWKVASESDGVLFQVDSDLPVQIPADGYLVMLKSASRSSNGDIDAAAVDAHILTDTTWSLRNEDTLYLLASCSGAGDVQVDAVSYDVDTFYGYSEGRTLVLDSREIPATPDSDLDYGGLNDDPLNLCLSTTAYGANGNKGTPGAVNNSCATSDRDGDGEVDDDEPGYVVGVSTSPSTPDSDGDGYCDGPNAVTNYLGAGPSPVSCLAADNCPANSNASQVNLDGDSLGDACDPDKDGDGVVAASDCDDTDATSYPGAPELCDGADNDCDLSVDEGTGVSGGGTFYADGDDDGYGDSGDSLVACAAPSGYVADSTDCDDGDAGVNPGESEVCDGDDNDCDLSTDEGVQTTFYADGDGDTYGDASVSQSACSAPAGYVANNTDCLDIAGCAGDSDCEDNVAPISNPAATEVCDGYDNDCDFVTDDGVQSTFYADDDGDGRGDAGDTILACAAPADGSYVADDSDCNDLVSTVYPGAPEIVDAYDNDCNGCTNETKANGSGVPLYQSFEGLVVVSEFHADPSGADGLREWIEVYNPSETDTISIKGWNFATPEQTLFKVTGAAIIPPETYLVLLKSEIRSLTGVNIATIDPDVGGYALTGNDSWALDNTRGTLILSNTCLVDGSDEIIDAVTYDEADLFGGNIAGKAVNLSADALDADQNDDTAGGSFCLAVSTFDGVDYGSPGDLNVACAAVDQDGDGVSVDDGDCDDADPAIYGGGSPAAEVCDLKDNDCDLSVDEGVKTTFYADDDGDTFGDAGDTVSACSAPTGYVAVAGDCDDANPAAYTGATEVCDLADNDCDLSVDEGVKTTFYADDDDDDFGDPGDTTLACSAPTGYVAVAGDCDDANPAAYTGATEVCDAADNDCDLSVDEGVKTTFYADADGDGYGLTADTTLACALPAGYAAVGGDCLDIDDCSGDGDCETAAPLSNPGASEICDTFDNDCDAATDEGVKTTFYADTDDDGFGDPLSTTSACTVPAGYAADNTDCDDTEDTVYPGADELVDAFDNDCDTCYNEEADGSGTDPGDGTLIGGTIIVSEIFADPSGPDRSKEWIELYNTTAEDIAVEGWTVYTDVDFLFEIRGDSGPAVIGAGDYMVLLKSSDSGISGVDVTAIPAGVGGYALTDNTAWALPNDRSGLFLLTTCLVSGEEAEEDVDDTFYDVADFVLSGGSLQAKSVSLDPTHLDEADNDDTALGNHCLATEAFSGSNKGSPGYTNEDCSSADSDGDGVIDSEDTCPLGLAVITDVDSDGCNDLTEDTCVDKDGDGVGRSGFDQSTCLTQDLDDSNDNQAGTCGDTDADSCDDCEFADIFNPTVDGDGSDADSDGICDDGDSEDCDGVDNDGDVTIDEDTADADSDGLCDAFDTEECDGVDNDGDAAVDEGQSDVDSDGLCDDLDTEECDGVDNDGDAAVDEGQPDSDSDGLCDDLDTEECDGVDNDGDAAVDEGQPDSDSDGLCDDLDTEECDGVDNDGDAAVDEGQPDSDSDGLCDDLDTEECDGVDNDGDAAVDEGQPDSDSDGLCDDLDTEECDGVDNDGDAAVDEGQSDVDSDGLCDALDSEDCDGVDNDGDAAVDEGLADADSDGLCDALDTEECDGVDNDGDANVDEGQADADSDGLCDDLDTEECDGVDNDGDAAVDEGQSDVDSDGLCDALDSEDCDGVDNDGDAAVDEGLADADSDGLCDALDTEECDGVDNDGDANVDEGQDDLDSDGDCDDIDVDADGDGKCADGTAGLDCLAANALYTVGDCDDFDDTINDDATEICFDSIDQDCNDVDDCDETTADDTLAELTDDGLGQDLTVLLDFNGDGIMDLLVAASTADGGGTDIGEIYLYLGDAAGIDLSTPDATYSGANDSDLLGSSIGAGDFNDDGKTDFIVGAPGFDTANAEAGAAYVVCGAASIPASGTIDGVASLEIRGTDVSHALGETVSSAGDLNQDGVEDFAIAVPGDSKIRYFAGDTDGNDGPCAPVSSPILATASDDDWTGGAGLGRVMTNAGDTDGDGFDDLLIMQDNSVFLLQSLPGSASLGSQADYQFEETTSGDFVGGYVAGGQDIDGDGKSDIVIGAPGYDATGSNNEGAVYIFYGAASYTTPSGNNVAAASADTLLEGSIISGGLGTAVALAANINGDAFADLIVSAPGAGTQEIYVILGDSGTLASVDADTLASTLFSAALSIDYGARLAALDIHGDGNDDLIIASPDLPGAGLEDRTLYLYENELDTDGDGAADHADAAPADPGIQ